jgi:hypothetical protein
MQLRVRSGGQVHDFNSNYENNTLTIGLNIYAGLTTINYFPSCEDDYKLSQTSLSDEQRKIPGSDAAGKELTGSLLGATGKLIPGNTYAIEITDESKWYEAGAGSGSYLVDISDDGGTTWTHLEDYSILCGMQIGAGDRYKIFFTAQSSNYKLRVRDGDTDFLSNTGWVMFNLYLGVNIVDPTTPGPGSTSPPPPEWVVACNETYTRPNSYISWLNVTIAGVSASFPVPRVGDWLEYIRNSITFYFAWCPQHTQALKSMGQAYEDREPLASIQQLMNFIKSIQTILEGAQAGGGEEASPLTSQEPDLFSDTRYIESVGGGDIYKVPSAAGPWDLFTIGGIDTETSIWYGGQLDMAASLGSTNTAVTAAYENACTVKFLPLFGIGASPYCKFMGILRFTTIIKWILLGADILLIVWLILKWLPGYVRRLWNLISGNKNIVSKLAGG